MAAERVKRSITFRVVVTPEMDEAIKECAAELGVSPSAWAAVRLGEAVRAQAKVGAVMESFGVNLATLVAESGGGE